MKKYLINLFIGFYENDDWNKRIKIFKSLDINWYQYPTVGHSLGFAVQGILDTDNKEEALNICNYINEKLGETIIVLSLIDMRGITFPIGQCNDIELVEPGRFFDKKIKEGEFGIFIKDEHF